MKDIKMEIEILYEEEIPKMTLAQIRAVKSFYGVGSFATYLNALSDEKTLANLSKKKLELQQSLEHFNQPLLNSNISQENGNVIVTKNDCWEYPLLESWITQLPMDLKKD